MTHKQRVLQLLKDGKPHSHHELYGLGCVAHSRISDLRRDGHTIEQWRDGDLYLYRLVLDEAAGRVPPPAASSSAIERFFAKVDRDGPNECWTWTGSKLPKGYGQLWVDEAVRLAHRFAYETFRGPIPEGTQIDHLCRNSSCVNPAHLEPVTAAENNRRSLEARRTGDPPPLEAATVSTEHTSGRDGAGVLTLFEAVA